ncbi:MAG TPA: hypothetical protein VMH84_18340, partial [Xanthobacteraceae bacterium]|nr:hypothetical protein [Xanthobacteraceae bacterium]
IDDIARNNFIRDLECRELTIKGLQQMIGVSFTEQGITEEKNQRITTLCNTFGIRGDELGEAGMRLAKSQILKRLDEGKLPEKVQLDGVPIMFERNETAVWLFNGVSYYTIRTKTQYVGASQGFSFRVMKGVYYRVGSYKGEPIQTQYMSEEARGALIITNQNLYFWSPQKVLKMPLNKIISMQPYTDGIQVVRDGANARPQIFKIDDPPFACDAIARLHQMGEAKQ